MRPGCIDCCYKHIADAAVSSIEVGLGYPGFLIYVVGHLDHASQEIQEVSQQFAWVLREHRINRQAHPDYRVPYEALAGYCAVIGQLHPDDYPEIPEDCLAGLDRTPAGKPRFSMDTRL